MIWSFLRFLDRKAQLAKISRYSKSGSIRIGQYANFVIDEKTQHIRLGEQLSLRDHIQITVGNGASLDIGDKTFMNNYCAIHCLHQVSIGKNVLFGENVRIYDHNHRYSRTEVSHREFSTAPIHIGDHCWIGSNCVILKGVTIGENTIIGAGCVIHRDIPANTLVTHNQNLVQKPR